MVSPINRVAQHAVKPQEVQPTTPRKEVSKTDDKKTDAVSLKTATPVRETHETKVEEVKEKPAAESAEALRTLASKEPSSPPPPPGKNTVSPEAVMAAYRK